MMLTIGFLDLQKQCDCTIVILPEGNNAIIIDMPEAEIALKYLEENSIEHIEIIFLTHFDDDHVKDVIKFCNLTKKQNCQIKDVRYNYSNALSKGRELTLQNLLHLFLIYIHHIRNAANISDFFRQGSNIISLNMIQRELSIAGHQLAQARC